MELLARGSELCDMTAVSELIWKSFYYHNSKGYPLSVIESFRDSVSVPSLQFGLLDGMKFLGAYSDGELVGVGALRKNCEIALLFVRHDRTREGIGGFLLDELIKKCMAEKMSVNASDFAISFYEKNGFRAVGERKCREGMNYTPMVLDLANAL